MADSRKRKGVFEVYERKRKASEERNKTRVFLGESFQRWRALKAEAGLPTDASVAKFLLDSYQSKCEASMPVTTLSDIKEESPDRFSYVEVKVEIEEEECNYKKETQEKEYKKEMDSGDDDSNTEDHVNPIHIRTGESLNTKIKPEPLLEMEVEEDTFLNCNTPEGIDGPPLPEQKVVNCPSTMITGDMRLL